MARKPYKEDIQIAAMLDGKALQPIIVDASCKTNCNRRRKTEHFSNIDLSERPLHKVSFVLHLNNDENSLNDTFNANNQPG